MGSLRPRRGALRAAIALAAASLFGCARAGKEVARPNLLLILADDWSWQGAEAVDRLDLHMPTFDRIRKEGIEFTNAFVASPSCTASRGAILSGRWPWRLEEGANLASILPMHFPLYPDTLESAGYHVGYCRKGWGPGQLAPAGRRRNPAGNSYDDFATFLSADTERKPFCFWFGTHDPHRPYVSGAGVRSGIRLEDITVPPYLPDSEAVRSDIADYRFELERLDREAADLLALLVKRGELDNTLVVMTGDNGWPFPRGKATLYDAGMHVPLAMMWPAGLSKPGRTSDAMVSLIDLNATFLEAAGVPADTSSNASSLIAQLRGSIASQRQYVIGGLERHMDGRTLPGQGYPCRAIRTAHHLLIRNFHPERWPAGDPNRREVTKAQIEQDIFAAFADIDNGPAKAYLVANRSEAAVRPLYDLAVGKRPAIELYDVQTDPYCMTNLAADPIQRATVERLDATLMRELLRTGDPRAIGNGDVFDRYPSYSDPGYGRPVNF